MKIDLIHPLDKGYCFLFSDELDQFLAVKRAFDPDCLLNPEKVIPTLARCAEYGKMHVHGGAIAFPDLSQTTKVSL